MAVTYQWCAGFESDGANSYATESDIAAMAGGGITVTSPTTNPKTSARHLRILQGGAWSFSNYAYWQRNIPATRQSRFGFFISMGWTSIYSATYMTFLSQWGATEIWSLGALAATSIGLYVGGVLRATWANAVISSYRYLQADVKIDPSAGWINIYCDGALVLSYSGNTGNIDATAVVIGGMASGGTGAAFQGGIQGYDVDDVTYFDTTGESAAALMSAYTYRWSALSADGSKKEFTPSTGTNHFALIDDIPHTGDTDCNYAIAANLEDSFTHPAFTRTPGYNVDAVIPAPISKRTDPAVDSQIKGYALNNAQEGVGGAISLGTDYRTITGSRILVDPNTGIAWTDAGINTAEIGWQSAGAFS